MKKLYSLILASLVMLAGCGEINDRLDALEGRVDNIENTQIATISQQITSINNSILLLNNTDKELKDYIIALEAEAENLQTQITATNTKIDEVKTEVLSTISSEKAELLADLEELRSETATRLEEINATIAELQAADGDMSAQIAALEAEAESLEAKLAETNTKIDNVKNDLSETISTEKANILAELEAFKATVNGELDAIKAVLETLKAKDVELDGKIATLQEYVDTELKATEDWATATFATLEQYEAVTTSIATINGLIEGLNESLAALETRLGEKIAKDIETACATLSADLQNAVTEITEAYTAAIATTKQGIEEAYTAAIKAAIAISEASMKKWVNEQLTGYYTIAQIDSKIYVLKTIISSGDVALQKEIDALETSLAKQKTEITEAYQNAIAEAITANNGVIDEKIATEIAAVNEKITALEKRVSDIESRLKTLENTVDDLLNRYLDITFDKLDSIAINAGSSCKVGYTITSSEADVHIATISQNGWKATITETSEKRGHITVYAPTPLTTSPIIVLVSDANTTIMRTLTFVDGITTIATKSYALTSESTTLSVGVTTNLEYEIIIPSSAQSWISLQSITTRAEMRNDSINLIIAENSTTARRTATLQLVCSDVEMGTISIHQSGIEVANNEIHYTTSDNKPITLYQTMGFSANMTSNTYYNGKGVIVFDKDITSIGEYAFYNCTTLTSVQIPKSIHIIKDYAFLSCSSLESITIPNNVTSIGVGAFSGCSSLTSVTIGNSVTSIEEMAFLRCSSLTSITIPDGVTSIGKNSFCQCSGLVNVTIPDSVISIESYAFRKCSSLKRVTIGNGVKSIGYYAFSESPNLEIITIGNSVASVGDYIFLGTNNIEIIYCKPIVPPTSSSGLFDANRVYVPAESVNLYKSEYPNISYRFVGYNFEEE